MLLRLVRNGVERVRFRPRPRLRGVGGLCASALRRHRQRIFPSIPSPRRACGPVRRWAGHHRRMWVPVCWRSDAGRWQFGSVRWWPVPANRRLLRHLLPRLRWLLQLEASVLRGECAVLLGEASVPSTGAARNSTAGNWAAGDRAAVRRRTGAVCGKGSATLVSSASWVSSETWEKPAGSSTWGAVKTSHRQWLWHHRGTEDEKKRGDGD